jgi:hypothetical protein
VLLLGLELLASEGGTEGGEFVVFLGCVGVNKDKHVKTYLEHLSSLTEELNQRMAAQATDMIITVHY